MIPEAYRKIITEHGAPGFTPEELVVAGAANRALPAPKFYNRIIEPLIVANLLRARMIARGAHGLTFTLRIVQPAALLEVRTR